MTSRRLYVHNTLQVSDFFFLFDQLEIKTNKYQTPDFISDCCNKFICRSQAVKIYDL